MNQLNSAEHLQRLRSRYAARGKQGKSCLIDELGEHYGYSRKHAIKLLAHPLPPPSDRKPGGAPPRYAPIMPVVRHIWKTAEQLCGKRLVHALPLWLPHDPKHFEPLTSLQRKLLQQVSAATLDRGLADERATASRGLSGTKPGTLLRRHVPIHGEVWDETRLGFLEADSVAPCGGSLAGDFIWSLTYTDLASGWTEGRAVWNKGATGVLAQTRDVEMHLPFDLLGFDFDNGHEWLNGSLIRHLPERTRPVRVTRSRPYHKEDNAHVEQKNWMWPRQLLGYGRLENRALVAPICALYKDGWGPLQNFFLPSMKLRDKSREGSRWVRRHDEAQTACQRILTSGQLDTKRRRQLRDRYEALDPFELAGQREKRLRPILKMAK